MGFSAHFMPRKRRSVYVNTHARVINMGLHDEKNIRPITQKRHIVRGRGAEPAPAQPVLQR